VTLSPHLRRGAEPLSHQAKAGVVPIPRRPLPKKKDTPKATYVYGERHVENPTCWLAQFCEAQPCGGALEHAHLIPQRTLRELGLGRYLGDAAVWEQACRRHHFLFDAHLKVFVPRSALSDETERFAAANGLVDYLDRRYGAREAVSA
jgi:hypothetical protein